MIAAIGVVFDEPILIVGAMVVGPDFGPLAALCVGLVRGRPTLIGRSLLALGVRFLVGIFAALLLTLALTFLGLMSATDLEHSRPLTDFIWRPNALSWVIGFLAGVAGLLPPRPRNRVLSSVCSSRSPLFQLPQTRLSPSLTASATRRSEL